MKKSKKVSEWYRQIGKKGGLATKKKLGTKHFSQAGKKGGAKTGRMIHAAKAFFDEREHQLHSIARESIQASNERREREWDE